MSGEEVKSIKVAATTAEIPGDDSMVIGGGIHPQYVSGQEGKIRASATVIEGNIKLCLVSCDVLMVGGDIKDLPGTNLHEKGVL